MSLRYRLLSILLCASAALAGCALPAHNNTLIFAVKRDVNLSVNTPSAAEPEFSINVGYKERQAAWVPLWTNKRTGGFGEKEAMDCTPGLGLSACMRSAKFVGDSDPGGKGNDAHDAYSTFASFGGAAATQVQGASATSAQFSGNLASFFATGVAAQHLAKDASKMDMVGTRSGQDKTKESPEQIAAEKLEKAIQKDTKQSLEELFNVTASYIGTTPTLAIVNQDCLGKLAKELDAKSPPDLSWVKGRSPEEAAEKLVSMGGMTQPQLRKLSAEANALGSTIKAALNTYDAGKKTKSEQPTPSERAKEAAKACKAS
jgi:hypothetical protein